MTLSLYNLSNWWRRRSLRARIALPALLVMAVAYVFCLPDPLFEDPLSLALEDREGELLGARIAADGQWRFPPAEVIPDKYRDALVTFEDKRFFRHPGVDPLSLGRAMWQNIRSGQIVSGGSTLSMQVIRLSRKGKSRTILEKIIEMILATRLEWAYSKEEILKLYASHAPFGGNVVGIEAASWRYFGKKPELLSWAEAATLAVLPNSPALIHPGRNQVRLLEKRDRLLWRLQQRGFLDSLSCSLAVEEPLPGPPLPLPRLAPHLLDHFYLASRTKDADRHRYRTTLSADLQRAATAVVDRHNQRLKKNEIHNCAAIILDVEENEVLAYVGNAPNAGREHGEQVDVIRAPRSTGSILKPFLYALALQEGAILPRTLLPDVPTLISGFRPENYHEDFDGAVPAREALIRSLNVPFVHLLREYGIEKFHFALKKMGISSLIRPPMHYGLSLILGGGEASLWEIVQLYGGMARSLQHYVERDSRYFASDFSAPSLLLQEGNSGLYQPLRQPEHLDAGAVWHTLEAMRRLERPNSEGEWELFQSSFPVAWKTGTSFGFRDAWAVGLSPRYVLGVWAGNADGEGRPGLVGVLAAAPLLFDLFDLLPNEGGWFAPPYDALVQVPLCAKSGNRASPICPVDSVYIPRGGLSARLCTYHRPVFLDSTQKWQLSRQCAPGEPLLKTSWFVLPPGQEYYYRTRHPDYVSLPPWRADCRGTSEPGSSNMQLIYPGNVREVIIPVDLDGQEEKAVFKAAHSRPDARIYWHLDNIFLGATHHFHELELAPGSGSHLLTLVDDEGGRLEYSFRITRSEKKPDRSASKNTDN